MSVPTTAWSETSPAGSDLINDGDNKIREMKTQIREVVGVDHDFPASGQDAGNGQHLQVTLQEQADLGTGAVDATILGSQTISGKGELVYTDEDDNDVQITTGGELAILGSGGTWRTGDLLLSSSTDTPTGWTDVSTTYDNKFLRIGDDTPLTTTGGADTLSGNSGDTTLSAAQSGLPAHTHDVTGYDASAGSGKGLRDNGSGGTFTEATSSEGGDNAASAHSHDLSSVACVPAYIQIRMYKKD